MGSAACPLPAEAEVGRNRSRESRRGCVLCLCMNQNQRTNLYVAEDGWRCTQMIEHHSWSTWSAVISLTPRTHSISSYISQIRLLWRFITETLWCAFPQPESVSYCLRGPQWSSAGALTVVDRTTDRTTRGPHSSGRGPRARSSARRRSSIKKGPQYASLSPLWPK